MTDDAAYDASEQSPQSERDFGGSTAFHIWLLITISAGIIMAQDTWLSVKQPRLGTMDATASFTKVLVIHTLWFLVSLAFLLYTWKVKTTSAWKIHIVIAIAGIVWTAGVLANAFTDTETLRLSTWQCAEAPAGTTATEEFIESCELAEYSGTIRMGGDIFFWSLDDKNYFRWIVPRENLVTIQTRWPGSVNNIYLAWGEVEAELQTGSGESVPGGTWSAQFDPNHDRDLRIYFVEPPSVLPEDSGTPAPLESQSPGESHHEAL